MDVGSSRGLARLFVFSLFAALFFPFPFLFRPYWLGFSKYIGQTYRAKQGAVVHVWAGTDHQAGFYGQNTAK